MASEYDSLTWEQQRAINEALGPLFDTAEKESLIKMADVVLEKIVVPAIQDAEITGVEGPPGPAGADGPAGPDGPAGTIAVGNVTQGGTASVTNVGTPQAAVLDFVLPQGPAGPAGADGAAGAAGPAGSPGPAGTISVGTVSTGAAGSSAIVTNVGTGTAAVLNFTIPRGDTGAAGPAGPAGPPGADGSAGPFTQVGTGAFTRTLQNKAAEHVSILDFYNPADGSNYSPALTRALAAHTTVFFPPQTYNFSTVVDLPNNARLIGLSSCFSDNIGGARITANAGFVHNPTTTRRRWEIYGLSITGNGTANTSAIKGPFGGFISDCRTSHYPIHIENTNSFLSRYYRVAFDGADTVSGRAAIGLSLCTANTVKIDDCYFAAYVETHITTRFSTPVGSGGTNNGTAIVMMCNNHNAASIFPDARLVQVEGNVEMFGNYFEDYNTAGTNNIVFVDYSGNAFGNFSFNARCNEMNGQGHSLHAFYFNATRANGSGGADVGGLVQGNRMLGFNTTTRPAIQFGTNGAFHGLQIKDNLPRGHAIAGRYAPSMYNPASDTHTTVSKSIAGATWIVLNVGTSTNVDNADAVSTSTYTARKDGNFLFHAGATLSAGTFPNCEMKITRNGVDYRIVPSPVTSAGPAHGQVVALMSLSRGDTVQVFARNGGNASSCYLVAVWEQQDHG